jgi:2',3'-cyclic-nucleotide 2'-phosphodiesterase (5'-nucleotidase family)
MSKTSRNYGAFLAVLFLALLVTGLVFVIKVAYVDEPKLTESMTVEATDGSVPTSTETEAPKDTRIAVFETSDINGYLVDTSSGNPNTFEYRLARIARIVNDVRESDEYNDVLLVDGGDIYQGALLSNLTEGAALRAAFDIMGYDAVTLGNHEFDWDVTTYATDTMATIPAYEIGEFKGDPNIPVIAATLYSSNNHNRSLFTKDYVIVEKAGYRIALIGYIPDYSEDIMSAKIEPFELHGDLAEFSERVKEINEAEKPDVTIVVAHENPVTVASALSHEDVDLVTGGHVHNGIFGVSENGIPFIQADNNAQGYASATIVIDPEGNVTIEDTMYTSIVEDPELLYDKLGNASSFDSQVLALSHAAWDSISEIMNEALGYIDSSVEKEGFAGASKITTTGGNFITGLMLEFTKDDGVVAAFCNKDGICADFTVPEGEILEISVGDIYAVNPYNYRWLIFDLNGEELAKLLADGIKDSSFGDQMSGLTFEYNNNGTEQAPDIEIVSVTLDNGTKVDIHSTEKKYRVVTTSYCAAQPGSVFEGKIPLYPEVEAPVDNQALIELLRDRRDKGQVHIPTDNKPRSTWLNAPETQETTETTETSETSETTQETSQETTETTQAAH